MFQAGGSARRLRASKAHRRTTSRSHRQPNSICDTFGRFVVADLSHGSHGAYWEAGFAEGLGLPVIYTCEEDAWKERKTHFDTNHMLTILWNASQLTKAGDELTAT